MILIIKTQFLVGILFASYQYRSYITYCVEAPSNITYIASRYFDFSKLDSVRFVKAGCETKRYAYTLDY